MKKSIQSIIILMVLFVSQYAVAQEGYNERARNYVKQYAAFAIEDQKTSGVPAAITLGQGILETEAGVSELVTEANNHFGIKCKNGWDGPTFLHTDDAKDECFKKYKSARESYNDHSAHLHRNPRYGVLFSYSITDYARWAHGLKKCGYATNPKYAQQLIKIIEDFRLQQYTYVALDSNYDFIHTEDGQALVGATKTETKELQQDALQPALTKTVITTTTTVTTQTITASGQQAYSPGRGPAKPQTASMPAVATAPPAVIKETSKGGMVAVSASEEADAIAAAPANTDVPPADTALPGTAGNSSPYLAEEPLDTTDRIQTINGLKAVRAHRDEPLLPYAVKYKIRYAHLLEMNDLPDEPLQYDTWIYLEKKNPTGIEATHTVREQETLLQIAQQRGMQLRRLAALNQLNPYEQPAPGEILNLQTPLATKPKVIDYKMPKDLPRQEVFSSNIQKEAPVEGVTYGMSFEAPKDEPLATVKPQDTTKREIVRQPFMKEDPPQMQMKQPATEPEYKKGDRNYLVKRGETAFSIAKKHNITVAQLLEWNHLDPQDLKAGQTLIVRK